MNKKTQDEIFSECLFKHCDEAKSGAVLITTNDNKPCQIMINDGVIVACTLEQINGTEAAVELKKRGVKVGSFKENLKLPYRIEAFIDSSERVLEFFKSSEKSLTDMRIDLVNTSF